MRVLALHGLPTGPRLWSRLHLPRGWTLEAPTIPGLGLDGTRDDWSVVGIAERLRDHAAKADLIIGHDLGGVIAALLATQGHTVVLSGTALHRYWGAIRLTAAPLLDHLFYRRHAGRLFLREGCLPEHRDALVEAFGDHGPGWADRMRRVALGMTPPPGLASKLRGMPVHLLWGRHDPWYPPPIPQVLAWQMKASLVWLEAGHFAPWEAPGRFSDALATIGEATPRPPLS
jgi:pimeloyl-ACP methyl ester carboxylesterase